MQLTRSIVCLLKLEIMVGSYIVSASTKKQKPYLLQAADLFEKMGLTDYAEATSERGKGKDVSRCLNIVRNVNHKACNAHYFIGNWGCKAGNLNYIVSNIITTQVTAIISYAMTIAKQVTSITS